MNTATTIPASVPRDELYELVWAEPMTKVAPRFGLSDVGLAKVCKRFDIPKPPVGYWAKKQFGKAPARTPLPKLDDESLQRIEFSQEEKLKSSAPVSASDRVGDEQLKTLIRFEEQPENRVAVSENPSKFHPFVRATKDAFTDRYADRQGLSSPNWSTEQPRLSISVSKESRSRALRFMDALIKAFEQRGHKVVVEGKDHGRDVFFAILGEKFSFRLREKTKMIRIPESERKNSYGDRVRYEPTGLLELQLWRRQTGMAESTWKDGTRRRLEDQLNDVLIKSLRTKP